MAGARRIRRSRQARGGHCNHHWRLGALLGPAAPLLGNPGDEFRSRHYWEAPRLNDLPAHGGRMSLPGPITTFARSQIRMMASLAIRAASRRRAQLMSPGRGDHLSADGWGEVVAWFERQMIDSCRCRAISAALLPGMRTRHYHPARARVEYRFSRWVIAKLSAFNRSVCR